MKLKLKYGTTAESPEKVSALPAMSKGHWCSWKSNTKNKQNKWPA
jgi:hypothetical protein